MAQRYIAIYRGIQNHVVCIDQCWRHIVAPLVIGYPGAVFQGFNNLNDAIMFARAGCTSPSLCDPQYGHWHHPEVKFIGSKS